MDKMELTKENLKKVLANEYSRTVDLRKDCEEGFPSLSPNDIRIFGYDSEMTVEFPCLHTGSNAFWCAKDASERTSKYFFGTSAQEGNDFYLVIRGISTGIFKTISVL